MLKKLKAWLARKEEVEYWWKLKNKSVSKNPIVRAIYRYKYHKLTMRFNAYIPRSVEFGSMPQLPHGLCGIFISTDAKLGKDCVIFQQVTIGSNTLKDSKGFGSPTLGDNVYIGAGAKIIGGVKIGNNVRIGANCVVTMDIPDNTTVVVEKPRLIQKSEPQDNKWVSVLTATNRE